MENTPRNGVPHDTHLVDTAGQLPGYCQAGFTGRFAMATREVIRKAEEAKVNAKLVHEAKAKLQQTEAAGEARRRDELSASPRAPRMYETPRRPLDRRSPTDRVPLVCVQATEVANAGTRQRNRQGDLKGARRSLHVPLTAAKSAEGAPANQPTGREAAVERKQVLDAFTKAFDRAQQLAKQKGVEVQLSSSGGTLNVTVRTSSDGQSDSLDLNRVGSDYKVAAAPRRERSRST